MANPTQDPRRCERCGSEMKPNPSYYDIVDCQRCDEGFAADPKDCRIRELERQLAEAKEQANGAAEAKIQEIYKKHGFSKMQQAAIGTTYENTVYLRKQLKALEGQLAEKSRQLEEAKANYQFVVDRVADERLDGYRELASKLERADAAARDNKAWFKALHFDLGKALGMMYEADGHNDEPAPVQELLDAVKRLCAERTQSQAREAMLVETLKGHKTWSDGKYIGDGCWNEDDEAALFSTAAHAEAYIARVKAEAQRDALDHAWAVIDHLCAQGSLGITRDVAFEIRDAIFGPVAPATNPMKGDGHE